MQTRIGEKLIGIGLLDMSQDAARFDLWCPDGMKRHDASALGFFNAVADSVAAAQPSAQASTD